MPDHSRSLSATVCPGLPGLGLGLSPSPSWLGHCWGQLTHALLQEESQLHLHIGAKWAAFGHVDSWTTPAARTLCSHRTPTWSTSWPLPTSLPKHTRCHRAATGRPPRPSSAAWSCRPSCPRRGSRSPSRRSRRRHRRLRVRLPVPLGPPGHVPRSSLVAVGLQRCSSLPQHPGGPGPRGWAPCHAPP